jgi:hypothetical protein
LLWDECEAAIRSYIEAQWALSAFAATIPLAWENETAADSASYMIINIEGTYADKTIYGGAGLRSSVEGGVVYFHCFAPAGRGKAAALSPVVAMAGILELQTLSLAIKLEGANPPSPVEVPRGSGRRGLGDDPTPADPLVPPTQPEGQFYRCSGSVPFVLIGAR